MIPQDLLNISTETQPKPNTIWVSEGQGFADRVVYFLVSGDDVVYIGEDWPVDQGSLRRSGCVFSSSDAGGIGELKVARWQSHLPAGRNPNLVGGRVMAHSSKLDPQTFDPFTAAEDEIREMLASPEWNEWCDRINAEMDREACERGERLVEAADCDVNPAASW